MLGHRILEVLSTDNGPPYAAKEFAVFVKAYRFQHITSCLRFPQSNGQMEWMVQTMKRMHAIELYRSIPRCALLSGYPNAMVWVESI